MRVQTATPTSVSVAIATLGLATVLWAVVFFWQPANFWLLMAPATGLLGILALLLRGRALWREGLTPGDLLLGVVGAGVLYGVFWVGNEVVTRLFDFAPGQVGDVYRLRSLGPPAVIAALLLLVIGPSEELYWRGLLQGTLAQRYGPWLGWVLGTAAYAGVHILSLNLMIMAAALVGGSFWGLLYLWRRRLAPALVCHAVWGVLIFVLFPLQ